MYQIMSSLTSKNAKKFTVRNMVGAELIIITLNVEQWKYYKM